MRPSSGTGYLARRPRRMRQTWRDCPCSGGMVTDFRARLRHRPPTSPEEHCVVVLGASPKPARYSHQAVGLLKALGYQVIPVHPRVARIQTLPVTHELRAIREVVHTLTLYVGPERSRLMMGDIIRLNPGRVIFNPGSECPELEQGLRAHHVPCLHGCTLVMLRTGQF
jgi:predicted CoA-binding protein